MTETAAGWTRISDRAEGDLVLAVDFYDSGRSTATFRDMVKLLPGHLDVWHAVPPPDLGIPARGYLAWWCDELLRRRPPIRAVLGYCAGGLFALAVADEIERHQGRRPTVVLFDPDEPTVDTLSHDFSAIIDSMTTLDDEERVDLHRRATEIRTLSGDDFDAVSAEYLAVYQKACEIIFARLGIDSDVGDQLTRVFRSYVCYLTAARQIDHTPAATPMALISLEHSGSASPGTEIGFDVRRAELLRDRNVATTAYELLMAGDDTGDDKGGGN